MHTYEAMSICANEHVFTRYYSDEAIKRAEDGKREADEWISVGNDRAVRKSNHMHSPRHGKDWAKKQSKQATRVSPEPLQQQKPYAAIAEQSDSS